jgi:hypothetical protein
MVTSKSPGFKNAKVKDPAELLLTEAIFSVAAFKNGHLCADDRSSARVGYRYDAQSCQPW